MSLLSSSSHTTTPSNTPNNNNKKRSISNGSMNGMNGGGYGDLSSSSSSSSHKKFKKNNGHPAPAPSSPIILNYDDDMISLSQYPANQQQQQQQASQGSLNGSTLMDDDDDMNGGTQQQADTQQEQSQSQSQSQQSTSIHDESFIQSQPIVTTSTTNTTTTPKQQQQQRNSSSRSSHNGNSGNHQKKKNSSSYNNSNNSNKNQVSIDFGDMDDIDDDDDNHHNRVIHHHQQQKKSSSSSTKNNHHSNHSNHSNHNQRRPQQQQQQQQQQQVQEEEEIDFASSSQEAPVPPQQQQQSKNQQRSSNSSSKTSSKVSSSSSSSNGSHGSHGNLSATQQERRMKIKQNELRAEKLAEEERERLLKAQMGDESLNRELYDHFNALQSVATQHKISLKLPELVVVGMQSDGKSSFVEALLGFQFNHVDTNIGTRRPLMLQMHHDPSRTKPYCIFQNEPPQASGDQSSSSSSGVSVVGNGGGGTMDSKPTPVHMLEHEIRRRTEQVCGEKGVSPVPICLHVYYKYCANLVIIDTPGFRKGDSDELSSKIEKMVMNLLKPQERIIVCLEQSTVEWCNTQVRPMIQRVDPNFSRTVFVCTKFNNRNNQFRDAEEVDKFLSTDGEIPNSKSVFFISLPSGHNARDLSEEEFKNKILEVYLQDYRHLSNIGFNQDKFKAQLGFYNLRRYLELMLNEKYKSALIPVLERIDQQIKKRQALVEAKSQELVEAQNLDVEQKANQLLTNFVNLVIKCLNGTNMFPTNKNGQTTEEEREKAGTPWPNYNLDFKIRNSQYKLYGGAQLERLLAEFEVVAHSQEFPPTTDDEVAVTIGLNSIHTMPDYDRGASELAQKKSKMVFQPLIDVLLARSRSIMRSMIVMVCGHLFHDNKQYKRVLQEMRNASDQFFELVINDAKEKCELEFDTFTRMIDWDLLGFGPASKQPVHEYDLLNPTKDDTIKRVQSLTDDSVAEKMLLFANDRGRELTEERCRKIKEAAARLFGGVRVLFVKYVRAKYLSFFLQPIFDRLDDHCRTHFHKLGSNRIIELADGPNPALIQQTIQQNKAAIESLVEQREKSLKLYNKFKTVGKPSSNNHRESL